MSDSRCLCSAINKLLLRRTKSEKPTDDCTLCLLQRLRKIKKNMLGDFLIIYTKGKQDK